MLDATAPPFDPADLEPSLRPFGEPRCSRGTPTSRRGCSPSSGTVLRRVLDLRGPRGRPGGDGRPAGGQGRPGRGAAGPGDRRTAGRSPTPAGTAATSCSAGEATTGRRRAVPVPRWTYDLDGALRVAPRFRERTELRPGRARAGRAAGRDLARLGVRQRDRRRGAVRRARRGARRRWSRPYAPGAAGAAGRGTSTWCAPTGRSSSRTTTSATTARSSIPSCARCQPAGQRRQLRPARRLGRRRDGPARRARTPCRSTAAATASPSRAWTRGAVLYLGLFPNLLLSPAPGLRDDPPAGAAGRRTGPRSSAPGTVARGDRGRPTRRTPWSSGTAPTGRTGPACESVQRGPRLAALPARPVRAERGRRPPRG